MDLQGQSNGNIPGEDKKDPALQQLLPEYGEKRRQWERIGEAPSQKAEEFYNQPAEEVGHSLEAVGTHPRVLSSRMAQSSLCSSSLIPLSRKRPDTEVSRPRFVSRLTCCKAISLGPDRHKTQQLSEERKCNMQNC